MNIGIYTFSTPVSLNLRSSSFWMFSQIAYPAGLITIQPLTLDAKFIDKTLGKAKIDQGDKAVPDPERVQDDENKNDDAPSEYRVYDIYEGTPSDDKNENTDKKD